MAPLVRIVIRYGVGAIVGMEMGDILAGDPDVIEVTLLGIGLATEGWYWLARKYGWSK